MGVGQRDGYVISIPVGAFGSLLRRLLLFSSSSARFRMKDRVRFSSATEILLPVTMWTGCGIGFLGCWTGSHWAGSPLQTRRPPGDISRHLDTADRRQLPCVTSHPLRRL